MYAPPRQYISSLIFKAFERRRIDPVNKFPTQTSWTNIPRDDFQLMYPKTSYQRKEHSQNNPPFEEKNRVQLILPWWTLFSSLNTVSPFVFPRPFVTFGPKHSSAPSFHRISALFPPVILPRHPIYTCRIHTQRFENLWRSPPPPIPQPGG